MKNTIALLRQLSEQTSYESCTDWYNAEGEVEGEMVSMIDDLIEALQEANDEGEIKPLFRLK